MKLNKTIDTNDLNKMETWLLLHGWSRNRNGQLVHKNISHSFYSIYNAYQHQLYITTMKLIGKL